MLMTLSFQWCLSSVSYSAFTERTILMMLVEKYHFPWISNYMLRKSDSNELIKTGLWNPYLAEELETWRISTKFYTSETLDKVQVRRHSYWSYDLQCIQYVCHQCPCFYGYFHITSNKRLCNRINVNNHNVIHEMTKY